MAVWNFWSHPPPAPVYNSGDIRASSWNSFPLTKYSDMYPPNHHWNYPAFSQPYNQWSSSSQVYPSSEIYYSPNWANSSVTSANDNKVQSFSGLSNSFSIPPLPPPPPPPLPDDTKIASPFGVTNVLKQSVLIPPLPPPPPPPPLPSSESALESTSLNTSSDQLLSQSLSKEKNNRIVFNSKDICEKQFQKNTNTKEYKYSLKTKSVFDKNLNSSKTFESENSNYPVAEKLENFKNKEMEKAEKQFEQQFKQWEEQFSIWKEEHKHSMNESEYNKYEAQWEEWRQHLLARKKHMNDLWLSKSSKTYNTILDESYENRRIADKSRLSFYVTQSVMPHYYDSSRHCDSHYSEITESCCRKEYSPGLLGKTSQLHFKQEGVACSSNITGEYSNDSGVKTFEHGLHNHQYFTEKLKHNENCPQLLCECETNNLTHKKFKTDELYVCKEENVHSNDWNIKNSKVKWNAICNEETYKTFKNSAESDLDSNSSYSSKKRKKHILNPPAVYTSNFTPYHYCSEFSNVDDEVKQCSLSIEQMLNSHKLKEIDNFQSTDSTFLEDSSQRRNFSEYYKKVRDYSHGIENQNSYLQELPSEDFFEGKSTITPSVALPSKMQILEYGHKSLNASDGYNSHSSIKSQDDLLSPSLSISRNISILDSSFDSKVETIAVEDLLLPGRKLHPSRLIIIMRGAPGSGKTFIAKLIKDREVENGGNAPRILSLDDYFMVETDEHSTTDKKSTEKVMKYSYEPELEEMYRQCLIKSFKKQIDDGFFPFIIVDCVNEKVCHFQEMCTYAKQKQFQIYVVNLEVDASVCYRRNTHGRTLDDIEQIIKSFEEMPSNYIRLDVRSLLQDAAIPEVHMEDESLSVNKILGENKEETSNNNISKWEQIEGSEEKLDKLDGLTMVKKRHSGPQSLKDWLHIPEELKSKPIETGQKRVGMLSLVPNVHWADVEEWQKQEHLRAVGFVLGQTDWDRITDQTYGQAALEKTKYI